MNRFSNIRDNTQRRESGSPGVVSGRLCWTCSKVRSDLGGRTDKRTRMWSCAHCNEAKK